MAIKGLTDQYKAKLETDVRGRAVRIGYLQKGRKEGHGRSIKLFDLDYFHFKAANQDEAAAKELEAIFAEVYKTKPKAINDVRIPVSLAGNFDIEKCAWLTASKHTKNGSIFLAQSDGQTITKARDEAGKVRFVELPHDDYSKTDSKGKDSFVYRDKLYPWQTSMAIDLILPEFNKVLFQRRTSGLGVVTLLTHSLNDIATLIGEYHQIIDEIASIFADPRDPHEVDRVRRYAPLRNIPLRLYRSEDKITSPAYGRDADPADKIKSTRWLLHWQLNPDFALMAHEQQTKRTALLLDAVGQGVGLLSAPKHTVESVNADLLGLPEGQPTNGNNGNNRGNYGNNSESDPEPEYEPLEADFSTMADTDDIAQLDEPEPEIIEGEFDEPEAGESDPWVKETQEDKGDNSNVDWQAEALKAQNLGAFSTAVYQLYRHVATFQDAVAVKKGYGYMFGEFDAAHNEAALDAIKVYANGVADGSKKKDAAAAATKRFKEKTAKPKKRSRIAKQEKLPVETTTNGAHE